MEASGMTNKALQLYLEIISRYPAENTVPYAYSRVSYIYLNSGKKVQEIYNFIAPALSKFKGIDSLSEISLVLAQYSYEKGDFDNSVKYYKKSISKAKGRMGAESYYRLGTIYYRQQKYKEALSAYLQVVFVYGKYAEFKEDALFKAAICFELIGNNEEAKKHYKEFVRLFPGSPNKNKAETKIKELK
jgi:TolA-binding protein